MGISLTSSKDISGQQLKTLSKEDVTVKDKFEKLFCIDFDDDKKDDFEEYLEHMKYIGQSEDGDCFMLRGQSGENIQISPGQISIESAKPIDSPEFIESMIEGAVLAKKAFGDNPLHANSPTIEEKMMMGKIASLTGVNLANKESKDLADTNPELAQKIDEVWKKVSGKYGYEQPAIANGPALGDSLETALKNAAPSIAAPGLGG